MSKIEHKRFASPLELKETGQPGSVTAVFSTFGGAPDSYGDVMMPGSIPNGQEVPMVWAHRWGDYPVGKGRTVVQKDRAVFEGSFFLDTQAGQEAYKTVKAMGNLQEYSFGFSVKDAEAGMQDGNPVRMVKAVDLFEVSPVLIGANRRTGTLSIKSEDEDDESPADDADSKVEIDDVVKTDDDSESAEHQAEHFAEELERVLLRAQEVHALRVKAGRKLSEARRKRLLALRDELDALLAETDGAPAEDDEAKGVADKKAAEQAELQAMRARFEALDSLYQAVESRDRRQMAMAE